MWITLWILLQVLLYLVVKSSRQKNSWVGDEKQSRFGSDCLFFCDPDMTGVHRYTRLFWWTRSWLLSSACVGTTRAGRDLRCENADLITGICGLQECQTSTFHCGSCVGVSAVTVSGGRCHCWEPRRHTSCCMPHLTANDTDLKLRMSTTLLASGVLGVLGI